MADGTPPDRKTLAQFGFAAGALAAVLFGLLLPWLGERTRPTWPWIVASVLWFLAIAAPGLLGPVHRVFLKAGHAIGRVNTRIVLGAVFFLVITPYALVMRIAGRDPLSRAFDPSRDTYRVPSPGSPRERMEDPF